MSGEATVAELCASHGVSRGAIYRRARKEGWPMRAKAPSHRSKHRLRSELGKTDARQSAGARTDEPRKSASGRAARKSGAPTQAAKRRRGKTSLASRLSILLDRKMTDFENRMAEGGASAADTERDARTLNTLFRLFEKLKGMGAQSRSRAAAINDADRQVEDAHDADRLRTELAQRLERLRRQIGG
jgi:hypothetical protein